MQGGAVKLCLVGKKPRHKREQRRVRGACFADDDHLALLVEKVRTLANLRANLPCVNPKLAYQHVGQS